ncbi:hypothetical protein [Arthrobacter psychrolactophilus]
MKNSELLMAGGLAKDLTKVTISLHTEERICNWVTTQDPIIERLIAPCSGHFYWPKVGNLALMMEKK